jgi:hypothetical protein
LEKTFQQYLQEKFNNLKAKGETINVWK